MNISLLKAAWEKAHIRAAQPASRAEIRAFERKYSVQLPKDMFDYFEQVNGMLDGEADDDLFAFYSLDQLETVADKFKDWHGVPKYSDALTTLDKPETYFVFSDFFINLEAFAIRLDDSSIFNQHVYAICGGIHQVVATSFSAFIDLYLHDSDTLII
ncbi:SMI1/KNR4 family protein [Hymenobacter psychrophilus]|uniref:SMI1 / KNR4 family (SUKH-1) n=1 Tax=Hymenobacter psychrophilus TaxID=651662 RepID=A0A1H3AQ80_9BACT|nr:SMI1/KNR4 family protein [Hymenobacter psychrophilus]SDX31920.1 SMI1 / KNR4 family (SUKH-1) [Hymenobacter psychrophilus]